MDVSKEIIKEYRAVKQAITNNCVDASILEANKCGLPISRRDTLLDAFDTNLVLLIQRRKFLEQEILRLGT